MNTQTLQLTRDNYYEVGNERELVISNSSLAYINPNQGGSLLRFKKYLSGDMEKKDSISLEKGKLLHSYMENRDAFVIENGNLPSESISTVIRLVYDKVKSNNEEFGTLDNHEDKIVEAAAQIDYGQSWKVLTLVNKVKSEGESYYKFLVESTGKIMLSAAIKDCLLNMITTVEKSPAREYLIDKKPNENSLSQAQLLGEPYFLAKELPILFQLDNIQCKALIDYVYIDFINKTVLIRDLKTTSQPVSKFMGTSHFSVNHNGELSMDIKNGSFQNYHYYRQLAFYMEAVKSLLVNPEDFKYGLIIDVVETVDPYEMASYNIPPQWIKAGLSEMKSLMQLVKDYIKTEKLDQF